MKQTDPHVIKPLNPTIHRKHRRKMSIVKNRVSEAAKSPRLSEAVETCSPVRKRGETKPINRDW